MGMDIMDYSKGRNPVPGSMEALHQPLHEATIVHSYIVPTGLWLCKASFVAMCTFRTVYILYNDY